MKKRVMALGLAATVGVFGMAALAGCNGGEEDTGVKYITTAIMRKANSGTRGAFDELVVNSEGKALKDLTLTGAWLTEVDQTGTVITTIAGKTSFLGYISMGSVDANKDKIKAVKVNGVEGTVANVLSGEYELSRPFNLIYEADTLSDAAKNFLSYIYSEDGAAIVNTEWIALEKPAGVADYTPYSGSAETVQLTGSTSLQPMIEVLAESYMKENENVTIKWGGGGSGEALAAVKDGSADFGMISREAKDGELDYTVTEVARDGIAVIVDKNCPLTEVTFDQLYDLYANGTKIECK